jgi:hypothetical protein
MASAADTITLKPYMTKELAPLHTMPLLDTQRLLSQAESPTFTRKVPSNSINPRPIMVKLVGSPLDELLMVKELKCAML